MTGICNGRNLQLCHLCKVETSKTSYCPKPDTVKTSTPPTMAALHDVKTNCTCFPTQTKQRKRKVCRPVRARVKRLKFISRREGGIAHVEAKQTQTTAQDCDVSPEKEAEQATEHSESKIHSQVLLRNTNLPRARGCAGKVP